MSLYGFTNHVFADESLAVSAAAIGFTPSYFQQAISQYGRVVKQVFVTIDTNAIRFRCDGINPTDAEGHYMAAGDSIVLSGTQALNFKAIRVTNDAYARVSYEL